MEKAKIDLIIKTLIRPSTSAVSISMYISKYARSDREALNAFLNAVCSADIFKAACAVTVLSGEVKTQSAEIVANKILQNLQNGGESNVLDLSAALELNRKDLLTLFLNKLSGEDFKTAFSSLSGKNACRLMRVALGCDNDEIKEIAVYEFYKFLNRYDSSCDNELEELLPLILQGGHINIISRLIIILGNERLKQICGSSWEEKIEGLILSNCQTAEIWEAHLSNFFASSHTDDELLHDGLWFLQLNASDELIDYAAALFYLLAAKKYGVDHPIFSYSSGFEELSEFPRRLTVLYDDILRQLWNIPEKLYCFIQKTEFCNPYLKEDIRKENGLLIKNASADYSNGYSLLSLLFENKLDCSTILDVFFNTFLKLTLTIDDLFYLARKFNVNEALVAAFEGRSFEGTIEKYYMGELVVSPRFYYATNLHNIRSYYFEIKYLTQVNNVTNAGNLNGCSIVYKIIGYNSGQVWVRTIVPANFADKYKPDTALWLNGVAILPQRLGFYSHNNFPKVLTAFPAEFFINDYDFDLITEIIENNTEQLEAFLKLFKAAEWNSTFTVVDISVPAHFYGEFKKYHEKASKMFKKLFSVGCDIDSICNLYFESIYKIILPFNEFILMTDKQTMLSAISKRRFYCKLLQGDSRHKCRLQNISCAPVCVVSDSHKLSDNKKLFVKCTDYIVYEEGLGKIIFVADNEDASSAEKRGKIYGFIALNENINVFKREKISYLPRAACYDQRELIFALERMREAVHLRKNSGNELLRLIRAFGNKSPYSFQQDIRLDVTYLKFFGDTFKNERFSEQITQMVLNTENTQFMAEIYLNTGFKYALSMDELVEIINRRRPELALSASEMFDRWEFICLVDDRGFLMSPFLPQYCVNVGKENAGKCFGCKIKVYGKGRIDAEILSEKGADDAVNTVLLCKMVGMSVDGVLPLLNNVANPLAFTSKEKFLQAVQNRILNQILPENTEDTDLLSAREEQRQIKQAIRQGGLTALALEKRINEWLEAYYYKVTVHEMTEMLIEIVEIFLKRNDNHEDVLELLSNVSIKYTYLFRSGKALTIWRQYLAEHYGYDSEDELKKKTKICLKHIGA